MTSVRAWLDSLERELETAARRAGLLEHGTMIGLAREFLVERVLRSFLPPIVHVATGKVIGPPGTESSHQVDILLYDARFPVFETSQGTGLYPVEGVLATIEVKSTLSPKKLRESLDNARSVLDLLNAPDACGIEPGPVEDRIKQIMKVSKTDREEAGRRAGYELIPATYVFAFKSRMKVDRIADCIDKWFHDNGEPALGAGLCALMPRIVVAGQSIGLLNDGYQRLVPPEAEMERMRNQYGPKARVLMALWKAEHRFGFLVGHIVHTVCNRLGPTHGASGARYRVESIVPLRDYAQSEFEGKEHCLLFWNESSS